MKASQLQTKLVATLSGMCLVILLLMPFHAFLTVWLSSLVGHYTFLRLWKELLLVILIFGTGILVMRDVRLRQQLVRSRLVLIIAAYLLLQIIVGITGYATHHVTAKALGYGWIVDTRFLLFFLVTFVVTPKTPRLSNRWPQMVLWPAAAVIVFGILQYFVLPYDVLKHVGYGEATIFPYETINHNIHHLRILSTLRGANPLGAYLVVVISLAVVAWRQQKKYYWGLLAIAGGVVLMLTFSRSAWIGMVLSLLILGGQFLSRKRLKAGLIWGIAAVIVVVGGAALGLRHNTSFQDAVFHTDEHSTIAVSSNQGHQSALKGGLKDMVHQPFGGGVGTAGPASVYNNGKVRIAENYFIQIGQEIGWLGLGLFLAINGLVGCALWDRRGQPLALGLFAALIGLSFVNLLSHAWADDTLAYMWWGLAGIALAIPQGRRYEV